MVQAAFPYDLKLMPIFWILLSFLIVKTYFRGEKFNSNFAVFTFMVIIDSLLINLFYAPFLIR